MKILKTQILKICPNCLSKVEKNTQFNSWNGYKARNGHVFCKKCGTEIK